MKKTKKTKTKNKTYFPISQRLEIWTIAQKWMTMNENVKEEEKKRKGREKDEENEKDENKNLS